MIEIFVKAADLPEVWDNIFANNNYMSKEKLIILEKCNPCNQRYIIINGRSAFIVYKLKLNIFTYSKMNLNYKVNIIGVPCSVSKQGCKIEDIDIVELENFIKSEKKGYIILNAEDSFLSKLLIKGETLPTCKLPILWSSFNNFLSSLRSHYRYRISKALKKGDQVVIKKLVDNSTFDEKMYSLYENVYEKSNYKLEKLSIDFFRMMPTSIYVFYIQGEPAAFVQLSDHDRELFFVFGGMNYLLNHKYDLYMNMLAFILRYGIEHQYLSIDMGQTAEAAKMKFGCSQYTKYMYIYHPNSIIRFLVKLFSEKLSYNSVDLKFKIFKEVS
jgi:hypothetical protein